ncbi:hypothetical protein H9623_01135 [Oerskovia sp. Sa1BUA8]|uniref:Tetratricopeptide repeat protein n=1 Tax=Oerskovia douganii TaxID=2762210 RepID=A0A9D5U689_9CELL|nr:hypothetical protein [Oerskovia douganii]MBE7698910.1 hypothetical protein [Oerskovia douganii]
MLAASDPAGAAGLYQRAAARLEVQGALDGAGFALAEAAQLAAVEQDVEGALAAFPRAVALLRAGGVTPAYRGPVVRAYARLSARAGAAGAGLTAVDKVLAEIGTPSTGGAVGSATGGAVVSTLTGDAASEGTVPAQEDGTAHERLELLDTRARLLATLGEHDRASAAAEAVAEEYARSGDLRGAAHAFWLAGSARAAAGDLESAVPALESAVDGFRLAHDQDDRARVGNELVGVLRRLGRDDEAGQVAESVSRR